MLITMFAQILYYNISNISVDCLTFAYFVLKRFSTSLDQIRVDERSLYKAGYATNLVAFASCCLVSL